MYSLRPGARIVLAASLSISALSAVPALRGQATVNSGSVSGTLSDPAGAVIPGATLTLSNPVSGLTRTTTSGPDGRFTFSNLPFNHYHLVLTAPGFATADKDLELRSSIPVILNQSLAVTAGAQTVEVHADDLIEAQPEVHTDLDADMIARIPTGSSSSGLSSILTLSTPGVAADSNGLFHPQGEHADTSFSVDGQPISDQQSRNFSNQLSTSSVQSMEVITGVAPAEYGDKASMVVRTTTKSGLNSGGLHGSLSGGYGTFGSSTADGTLGFGTGRYGTFTAVDLLNTGRFLDSPEFEPLHDHGNSENLFERVDAQTTPNDSAHININVSRSWTQQPNQFDQNAAGQDQRQEIKSFDIAPTYTHLFGPNTLLSANTWIRQDQVHYYPSGNVFADTPATLSDTRRLTNTGIKLDLSHTAGIQTFKGGAIFQHTPLSEAFGIGITSPTFNAPCIDANGSPLATATRPCTAIAGEQPNPAYVASEAPLDLTRGGAIAHFGGTTDIKEEALYLEDSLAWHNWNASGGVRADNYNGISSRSMVEPRAGLGYRIQRTNTALRGSYGKFFLTPYNENLIASSAASGLASSLGSSSQAALTPAKRNHFSAGFEQGVSKYIALQADYFWKFTDRDFDFDTVLNTPLAFPIQWRKSKIDGYSARINLTNVRGLTAYTVLGHTRARFFGPETGGILFNDTSTIASTAPFRIDHDQNFQQTTHFQFQPRTGSAHGDPWYSFNWSYESGEVAGAAPFATSADATISLTYLSADQQAQIDLTCGAVRATLAAPLTSCAPAQLSSPLLQIPAPGTENDDRHPPRVAPRNTFDMATGWDNLLHRDRLKTNISITAANITNKYALYNFLSTFSGTHFLSPRTLTGQLTVTF